MYLKNNKNKQQWEFYSIQKHPQFFLPSKRELIFERFYKIINLDDIHHMKNEQEQFKVKWFYNKYKKDDWPNNIQYEMHFVREFLSQYTANQSPITKFIKNEIQSIDLNKSIKDNFHTHFYEIRLKVDEIYILLRREHKINKKLIIIFEEQRDLFLTKLAFKNIQSLL